MEDKKAEIAAELGATLFRFETALQEAFAIGGELTAVMARAPMQAGVSPGYAQSVFVRLPTIMGHILEARGETNDMHHGLGLIQKRMSVTFSPPTDKDNEPKGALEPAAGAEVRRLRPAA